MNPAAPLDLPPRPAATSPAAASPAVAAYRRPARRYRAAATATLALVGALVLAACSSTPAATSSTAVGSASDGLAYATAQIEKFSVDPTFDLTAPAFPMKDIAGKTIFNIPNSTAVPYIVAVDEESKTVAESYGATWVEYTNQGSPTEHAAGIEQAISQKADIIVLAQGINAELLIPQLQLAKAAGIPVIITHTYQNGDSVPSTVTDLIAAQVTAPFNESGRLSADWAIKDTGGKANVLIINSAEVPPSAGIVAAMQDELGTHCSGCTVKVVNVPVADWATKINTTVQSELQINPNLNYVLPVYDSMALYVEAGVTAAGKVGQVKAASFNGTPDVLKIMQNGSVLAMDSGENVKWLAWSTLDQAGRVLTGNPIIADGDEKTPLKVFTKDNVDETGTPPVSGQGYGDAFEPGYTAMWGQP